MRTTPRLCDYKPGKGRPRSQMHEQFPLEMNPSKIIDDNKCDNNVANDIAENEKPFSQTFVLNINRNCQTTTTTTTTQMVIEELIAPSKQMH
jgi:hypothetical protein